MMKNSKLKLGKLIMCFILIFGTDTFVVFANQNEIVRRIFQISSVIGILCIIGRNREKIKVDERIFLFVIMCCLLFASVLYNMDFVTGNFIKIFVLLFGWAFSLFFSKEEFRRFFVMIVTGIALFSLIVYVLAPMLKDLSYFPLITNTSGKTLKCFFLSNIDVNPDGLLRNWGPFWEPGVFQTYLNLALFFLFQEKNYSFKASLILILGIITTFSTTGIISLILILCGEYIKNNKLSQKKIIFSFFAVVGIILLLSNPKIYEIVFGKFNKDNFAFLSTQSRLAGVKVNLQIMAKSPILGVGVSKLNNYIETFVVNEGLTFFSNTNGLLMNFSIYGCLLGVCYLYALRRFTVSNFSNKRVSMVLFILLIMQLFAEPLINSYLFNTIIFMTVGEESKYGKNSNVNQFG